MPEAIQRELNHYTDIENSLSEPQKSYVDLETH